jgi:hypothetical protein
MSSTCPRVPAQGPAATAPARLMRTTRPGQPCQIDGPVTGETPDSLVVDIDYGGVGRIPFQFRRALLGVPSAWGGTTTHVTPCQHCPDYIGDGQ